MFKRALVFRGQTRSLGAAIVLTIVLTLVMTIATPGSAAHAEEAAAPAPADAAAAAAASVAAGAAASVEPASVEPAQPEPAPVEPAPVEPAPVEREPTLAEPAEPAPVDPAPIGPQPQPTLPEEGEARIEEDSSEPGAGEALAPPALAPAAIAPMAVMTCNADAVYSLSPDGAVSVITGKPESLAVTETVIQSPRWSGVDALGAGNGTLYAVRNYGAGTAELLTLDSDGTGWTSLQTLSLSNTRPFVAGAVNGADGRYYFGGFSGSGQSTSFRLYRFDGTGVSTVGSMPMASTMASLPADIAFDTAGNLYLIVGVGNQFAPFTVTAAELARGGTLERVEGTNGSLSNAAGLAFRSDGYVVVSNDKTGRAYDPLQWANGGGNNSLKINSSDLAGCGSPVSITLQKDVRGRADLADQFELRATPAGSTTRSRTTTGAATGPQEVQVGPIAVLPGTSISLAEVMAAGSASAFSSYSSSWSCSDGSSGNGTTATVTMPTQSMICTFVNAPVDVAPPATTVTVRKLVIPAGGSVAAPRADWPVDLQVAGAGAAVQGANPEATGADGTASWTVAYETRTTAELTVSEQQLPGYRLTSLECTIDQLPVQTELAESTRLTSVAAGSDVRCTFINEELPTTLSIAVVVDGNEPATSWPVAADAADGAAQGPSGDGAASGLVAAGAAYDLTLGEGSPYYVQDGGWTCSVAGAPPVTIPEGSISLSRGDAAVCTVRVATARMVLLKQIEGASALRPEQFTLTATPERRAGLDLSIVSTTGTADEATAAEFEVRPDTAYALGEQSQFAYLGVAIEQRNAGTGEWSAVTDPSALVLDPGERAVIRFVNAAPPVLTLPVTGGIGAEAYLQGGIAILLLAMALLTSIRMRDIRRRGRLT